MVKFKIYRFEKGKNSNPRFENFTIKEGEGMTILDALFKIKDEIDGTLSFRYSCRGAVCGSCGMLINGSPMLACRTQVGDLIKGKLNFELMIHGPFAFPSINKIDSMEIQIEPLPNFAIIKDLVVDMKSFFNGYESIDPWFIKKNKFNNENKMRQKEMKAIEPYINCIMCGICFSKCPSAKRDNKYLGPATLAKAWRFLADSRFENKKEMLKKVDSHRGVWACDTVYRCVDFCPKNVPSTQGITAIRRKLLLNKLIRW